MLKLENFNETIMISISCLESKLLNNNNWYGRFQLAPFQKGEGLTVANALRRTLLAEKSNFFITWVDFYNAEIPYSVLTGMRESIFDILLNLKQVVFTSDKILANRNHFLKTPSAVTSSENNSPCWGVSATTAQKPSRGGFLSGSRSLVLPIKKKRIIGGPAGKKFQFTLASRQNPVEAENKKTRSAIRFFKNVFCQNQILGKSINSKDQVSPNGILGKTSGSGISNFFLNTPAGADSKKSNDSTYLGYICAKGPTIIYAKNLKLPLGLKCVDPDKYIVTLADDGLFYLRFALTTEIKSVPFVDSSNLSISIYQGIKFNQVRSIPHRTFPKILVNKEIDSSSSFQTTESKFNKGPAVGKEKNHQPCLNTLSKQAWTNRFIHKSIRSNHPPLGEGRFASEKKIPFLSHLELYNSEIRPINDSKNLIKEQRLILTNDSIKAFNFQNTSIVASIQKTCLLNLQVKHYYYKCGRFDRFLFDLIKPFKPTLKSTKYNESFLKKKSNSGAASLFYQSDRVKPLPALPPHRVPGFNRAFENPLRDRSSANLSIDDKPYKSVLDKINTVQPWNTKLPSFQSPINLNLFFWKKNSASSFDTDNGSPIYNSQLGQKNKSSTVRSSAARSGTESSPLRARVLTRQKIWKSMKTTCIYDYFKKLSTSQTASIYFLPTSNGKPAKSYSENRISLLTNADTFKAIFNFYGFPPAGGLFENSEKSFYLTGPQTRIPTLYELYLQKFLHIGFEFVGWEKKIFASAGFSNATPKKANSLYFINKNSTVRPFIHRKNTGGAISHGTTPWGFSFIRPLAEFSKTRQPQGADYCSQKSELIKPLWMDRNPRRGGVRHDSHLREFYYSDWKKIGSKTQTGESIYFSKLAKNDNAPIFFRSKNPLRMDKSQTGLSNESRVQKNSLSHNSQVFIDQCCSGYNKKKTPWSMKNKNTNFFSPITSFKELAPALDRNGSRLAYSSPYTNTTVQTQRNQPRVSLKIPAGAESFNPIPSLDSVQHSVALRAKPLSSIRQISYKPLCMVSCMFLENIPELSFGYHCWGLNSRLSVHTPIYKNLPAVQLSAETEKFLNWNWFAKPTQVPTSEETINNSVVLKGVYLNVEQIIYILKQTTKFRKNQRINPKFLDSITKYYNPNSSLYQDFRLSEKLSNSSYNSPRGLFQAFPTNRFSTARRADFLKNSKSSLNNPCAWSGFPAELPLAEFSICLQPQGAKGKHQGNVSFSPLRKNSRKSLKKKNSRCVTPINRLAASHRSVFASHFVFKSKDSSSCFGCVSDNSSINRVSTSPQRQIKYGLRSRDSRTFICSKSFDSVMGENLKPAYRPLNDLYNEPYNVNISNSKISFNLRYTYPLKYTIFETFLPFLNFSHSQSFLNWSSLFGQEIFQKQWSAKKSYQLNSSIKNSPGATHHMLSCDNFDFIQYNESFKIYTTLAYTCLKTHQPDLPKYNNFKRPYSINRQKRGTSNSAPLSTRVFDLYTRRVDGRAKKSYLMDKIPVGVDSIYFKPTMVMKKPVFSKQQIKTPYRDGSIEKTLSTRREYNLGPLCNSPAGVDNLQLPSVFDHTYKWRIINNSNFNDAFITIPCTWTADSRNTVFRHANFIIKSTREQNLKPSEKEYQFKQNGLESSQNRINNRFYSSIPSVQNLVNMNSIFQKNPLQDGTMFPPRGGFFCETKETIKNRLFWCCSTYDSTRSAAFPVWGRDSKIRNTADRNELLYRFRPEEKKNQPFQAASFHNNSSMYNPLATVNFINPLCNPLDGKKLFRSQPCGVVSTSKSATLWGSEKKIAINFETIYYKNFLWNSRKITLRILNNAVLPLTTNRKSSMKTFVPSTDIARLATSRKNQNKTPAEADRISPNWLYQSFFTNQLSEMDPPLRGEQPPFYSIQHKTLETTNFLCSKTSSTLISQKETPKMLFPNSQLTQAPVIVSPTVAGADSELGREPANTSLLGREPALSLYSRTPENSPRKGWQASGVSSPGWSASVNPSAQRKKSWSTENYLLSYNQVTPEKLAFFRKRQWTERLTLGPRREGLYNSNNISSRMNLNDLSIVNNNLWWSEFYCKYSLYAISTKSDLFLQNLISFSGLTNQISDTSRWAEQESSSTPGRLLTADDNLTEDRMDTHRFSVNQIRKTPDEPLQFKVYSQYQKNNTQPQTVHQFLNPHKGGLSIKVYEKIIQKILQSETRRDNTIINYLVPRYDYNWQKTIHFAILSRLKIAKLPVRRDKLQVIGGRAGFNFYTNIQSNKFFQYPKKNIDSISINQNSMIIQKNQYLVKKLKRYKRNFGNPLRRRITGKSLSIYNIQLPTVGTGAVTFYPKSPQGQTRFATPTQGLASKYRDGIKSPQGRINQAVLQSWKSTIWITQANRYFCFGYPFFIQSCNLPWQKLRYRQSISKHWIYPFGVIKTNRIQETNLKRFACKSNRDFIYLSKAIHENKKRNTRNPRRGGTYTQLTSSSNKTHQHLSHTEQFKNLLSSIQMPTQNQGSYKTVGYFTINEGLNCVYKVNYIVESYVSELGFREEDFSNLHTSYPTKGNFSGLKNVPGNKHFGGPSDREWNSKSRAMDSLKLNFNQINDFNSPRRNGNKVENSPYLKKLETIQLQSVNTDSLTISNFLNATYSFVPNKSILLNSFNESISFPTNKSQVQNENESIQIDIWTTGESTPRQALLNAFKKLFELFYNLSKYNCLKPIEI